MLSPEQHYAFEKFKRGENLFITGPGGTGKTKLIQTFVQYMLENNIKFQVCALTGCAAVLLGNCKARTLHSWSGMGLANGPKDKVIQKIIKNRRTISGWNKVKILIIDEVSMMSKKVFEIIEQAGRNIKKSPLPFGGIQVIFTGDFFQLPPVGNIEEEDTCKFAFESEIWSKVFPRNNNIQLHTIFRQKDKQYTDILNQIRQGYIDDTNKEILSRYVNRPKDNIIAPAKLFAIRAKADFVNKAQYSKLEGEEINYTIEKSRDLMTYMDSGKLIESGLIDICRKLDQEFIDNEIEYLITNNNRVQILGLKIGASVMCLHNLDIDNGICNGSQGIIKEFITKDSIRIPVVLFSNGIKIPIEYQWIQSDEYPCIGISQIPLCLSWALTIHKIQGATLPIAEMDLGNSVFEYGQSYVALSRIQSMEGLYLSAFQANKIKANPIVKQFYAELPELDYSPESIISISSIPIKKNISPKNIFERFNYKESESDSELVEEKYITDPNIKRIRI